MSRKSNKYFFITLSLIVLSIPTFSQSIKEVKEVLVGPGWAKNSINTVVFRKNALCTFGNTQYISYYNEEGFVVLGKRKLSSDKWELKVTQLKGNVADAHNSISIITDADGYLHMAWNHHGNILHYTKSVAPGSLEMTGEMPMTGLQEEKVTYPEFYLLREGNLLFLYRDGQSGQGNLVVNRYDTKGKKWIQLHGNLIDGEKKRNAYWQACVDDQGTIHISWVWRESPDVASNHDMCYARSKDGGMTWENSSGERYQLPINAATAEYAWRIPQKSELINQTSMSANNDGDPIIATYWKEKTDSVPQYRIIYRQDNQWHTSKVSYRSENFSLSGAGTKRIPISRPQVVRWKQGGKDRIAVIFRDEERSNRISVVTNVNGQMNKWEIVDLSDSMMGSWEPNYDSELWRNKKQLHLFVQYTDQVDAEGKSDIPPKPVKVVVIKI